MLLLYATLLMIGSAHLLR